MQTSRFLPPFVAIGMIIVVNLVPGARENGWFVPVSAGISPTSMFKLWPWAHLSPGHPPDGNSTVVLDDGTPVPSVKWDLLWSHGLFAITVIEALIVGLLALLEDLALVHKSTAVINPMGAGVVNLNWEVQLQGLMNIVAAGLCGLPATLVGSYSYATLKIGGGGFIFYATQAAGSAVVLASAQSIVQSLPTMVPCFILFWVALQMAGWGLWDMRPVGLFDLGSKRTDALDPFEYALVWVMVITSLDPISWVLPGSGFDALDKSGTLIFVVMMALGTFFAFFHTIRLLRSLPKFQLEGDVATVRSDVLRSTPDDVVLGIEGRRVLVVQIRPIVVSFHVRLPPESPRFCLLSLHPPVIEFRGAWRMSPGAARSTSPLLARRVGWRALKLFRL